MHIGRHLAARGSPNLVIGHTSALQAHAGRFGRPADGQLGRPGGGQFGRPAVGTSRLISDLYVVSLAAPVMVSLAAPALVTFLAPSLVI
jgi:hypothetical protein